MRHVASVIFPNETLTFDTLLHTNGRLSDATVTSWTPITCQSFSTYWILMGLGRFQSCERISPRI